MLITSLITLVTTDCITILSIVPLEHLLETTLMESVISKLSHKRQNKNMLNLWGDCI